MSITAADVKKLRDATGAGMMDCKAALTEADGDFDKAVELLRVKGAAKAAKRGAEREATAGLVVAQGSALAEINCETDFVAKGDDFVALADEVVAAVEAAKADDRDAALTAPTSEGRTVAEAIEALAGIIGEKLQLGRVAYVEGTSTTYLHRRSSDLPPAVGVLVAYAGDQAAAHAAAMQVAAMRPQYLSRDEVPEEVIAQERGIAEERARDEGKPDRAIPTIVEGRVNAFFKDVCLLDQPSVQENKKSVGQVLDAAGTTISRFVRIEVGQ